MSAIDAILLIAFGGPERPEEVRPFLRRVTEGRSIPEARLEEVAHHYEAIGGRSPLNELTRRQARALSASMAAAGDARPVFVGMRNWPPLIADALGAMGAAGRRRALGIILSSFQTEASWDRYHADVAAARAALGAAAPEVVFAPPWADHPCFIAAAAERLADALGGVPADRRAEAPVIFTAHSVPRAMAAGTPYAAQLAAAARAVAERLGRARWSVAYQSRSGSPRDPWLEPDVGAAIRQLAAAGARDAVVSPIGFVCDHVEVLYDLDVEARRVAEAAGVGFYRAAALNDHPSFVALLADLVRRGAP